MKKKKKDWNNQERLGGNIKTRGNAKTRHCSETQITAKCSEISIAVILSQNHKFFVSRVSELRRFETISENFGQSKSFIKRPKYKYYNDSNPENNGPFETKT